MSLPARGVWVEILLHRRSQRMRPQSLPARGVWVEITSQVPRRPLPARHSPHGECGLKFVRVRVLDAQVRVTPRTGSVG